MEESNVEGWKGRRGTRRWKVERRREKELRENRGSLDSWGVGWSSSACCQLVKLSAHARWHRGLCGCKFTNTFCHFRHPRVCNTLFSYSQGMTAHSIRPSPHVISRRRVSILRFPFFNSPVSLLIPRALSEVLSVLLVLSVSLSLSTPVLTRRTASRNGAPPDRCFQMARGREEDQGRQEKINVNQVRRICPIRALRLWLIMSALSISQLSWPNDFAIKMIKELKYFLNSHF